MASWWHHHGVMDLALHVENLRRHLTVAAEAGGEETRAVAERLAVPMEAAIRLTLQEAVAAAAEEISCELAAGSVEVRLAGRDLEFVVTPPSADLGEEAGSGPGRRSLDAGRGVRGPDQPPPARPAEGTGRAGGGPGRASVNTWLVRAAAAPWTGRRPTADARSAPRSASPAGPAKAPPRIQRTCHAYLRTREPISVSVELGVGGISISAGDRPTLS